MNLIKKVALYSALIGSLAFGGNALAQSRDSSAYELQKRIGADLEIFQIEQSVFKKDGVIGTLYFGDSIAQSRDDGNAVYVWYKNPKIGKNGILTKIQDLNGDGIVDVVIINDPWKSSSPYDEEHLIHRIDNVSGPQSVITGPHMKYSGERIVVSDTEGIAPYQRVFDFFKMASTNKKD